MNVQTPIENKGPKFIPLDQELESPTHLFVEENEGVFHPSRRSSPLQALLHIGLLNYV